MQSVTKWLFIPLGLGILIWLTAEQPLTAQEPSPVPCRLAKGQECTFQPQPASSELIRYPPPGADYVPVSAWVSVRFTEAMDESTINEESFYLLQENDRLSGTVRYIAASQLAVFQPARPLPANTTYTATLTRQAQTQDGDSLPTDLVWQFTTDTPTRSRASLDGGMNIYLGDLHSHAGYSDGQGTPAEAYASARASGLDFFALTEHGFFLTDEEWADILRQAETATQEGQFIGLRGFEYTPDFGHINVFETRDYVMMTDPRYNTLTEFYDWLLQQPTAFAQFNHPSPNFNFYDFAFEPAVDQKIVLRELTTPSQFFLSLDAGWHLGTLMNTDTHQADWGCCPLMGLIAPELTKPAIIKALRARRTFFLSPFDRNFALVLQANGYWMGSAVPETDRLELTVIGHDPDASGSSTIFTLYENGNPIEQTRLSNRSRYEWRPTVSAKVGHYYFVEAYQDGWGYPAYSSPIWVERRPVARLTAPQTVRPGSLVRLDGRVSYDDDGDVLAYHWQQIAGPTVTLTGAETAQVNFVAPANNIQLQFRLTVVDTGDLQDSQEVTIQVVDDQPVLTISKRGPAKVAPNEPFQYHLTVVNSGAGEATNVVITDTLPVGATYINGGTRQPNNIIQWTVPRLAANGGQVEVSFTVTTDQAIVNWDYGATCSGCEPVTGRVIVVTNGQTVYLPLMSRSTSSTAR